jgi:ferrochelatase
MPTPSGPTYLGEPDFRHDRQERLGILLANLGTPASPKPADVRRFLAEFLSDPRVVEVPRWIWRLVLHGVILRIRPRRSAHAYQQVWTPDGSPLLIHTRALAQELQNHPQLRRDAIVAVGMSYGAPSISSALRELKRQGARRLLVIPLYPQYSGTTTASVFDRVTSELQRWRWLPELRTVAGYADEPAYIQALADSVRERWRTHERGHLLFSFHGIPYRYFHAGDPYFCECQKTARLVAEALHLSADEWSVSFQSQVGRERWLQPYTDELLAKYARSGPKRVTVICAGFATDCLETLEEIAIRNRATFLAAGGEYFDYVPSLNSSASHVDLLLRLVERHTAGWLEPESDEGRPGRARALGAAN